MSKFTRKDKFRWVYFSALVLWLFALGIAFPVSRNHKWNLISAIIAIGICGVSLLLAFLAKRASRSVGGGGMYFRVTIWLNVFAIIFAGYVIAVEGRAQ